MDRGRTRKNNKVTNRYCTVPQCKNKQSSSISIHLLPKKNVQQRHDWLRILKYGKKPPKNCFVCSEHFTKNDFILPDAPSKRRNLKKGAVPSRNLPKTTLEIKEESKISTKKNFAEERRRRYESRKESGIIEREVEAVTVTADGLDFFENRGEEDSFEELSICFEADESVEVSLTNGQVVNNDGPLNVEKEKIHLKTDDHNYVMMSKTKDEIIQTVPIPTAEIGVQVNPLLEVKKRCTIVDILCTAGDLNSWTGIPDFTILDTIEKNVKLVLEMEELHDVRNNLELSLRDRIILIFIRLKIYLSFKCLGVLFGVSNVTCTRYYEELVPVLGAVLKVAVEWPSKKQIERNMPKYFVKYKDTRTILDCTEISAERSKCVNCRLLMYSNYKGTETVKFLIGVAPSGLITFVSNPFGGRASDKAIFNKSDLLTRVTPHKDAFMVDKGFLIENECQANNIKLYRPYFLRKKNQFDKEEALTNVDVAAARVHVERAIQRLKIFKILRGKYPFRRIDEIENVLYIISGLTNLCRPILADDKFA